ncbi:MULTISPECIES: HlyD family secretion protein [unclassified Cyanobium]|uniref:HlyD family secretion protein n=1 Tax=unclassified Cyanobium TaxID=2627006 RepID=UPI0037BF2DB8|nr:HlyD family efflux transporter periplasmic adaptor subunit [Cyanobium sp. Cruz-8H5]MCP9865577.1 HlyD family efflux transporter periplasmic adaptor subunit [Cyanobium sp. Cruz-8D1]
MPRFRSSSRPRNPFRRGGQTPPPPPLAAETLAAGRNPVDFIPEPNSPLPELGQPPGGGPPGGDVPGGDVPGDETPPPNPLGRRRVTLPRSTRVWSRAIVWSLIFITTGGTIYGLVAQIESSVASPGTLRPIGGVSELAPPLNGLVQQVLVKNGQQVQRGQVLVRLRDDSGPTILNNLKRIQAFWTSEVRVLARQLNIGPLPTEPDALAQLMADELELQLRVEASQRELARTKFQSGQQWIDLQGLRAQLSTNENISARMRSLVSQGAMAQLDLDRQLERQQQIITSMKRTENEWKSSVQRVEEARLKSLQIPAAERRQVFTRFNNARQQLIEVNSKLSDQQQRASFQLLRAPISGKVIDVKAKVGELSSPAEPVLRILPNSPLEAHLDVSNRDVGFLRKGMKVDIRIDSFPSTEYGSITGFITSISDDALPPDEKNPTEHFSVSVKLNKQQLSRRGVNYSLRPGMSITGLINLNSRPALSLITDRFNRFFESSRTIR